MSFPVIQGVEVVLEAPEGYKVNFDNPRHDRSTTNATIWLFCIEFIIGSFFFGQRMYTNGVLVKNFHIDDYLLVFAYIMSTVSQVLVVYMYSSGLLGTHAFEMPLEKHDLFSLMLTISTLCYIFTTIISKLCLFFFYYRLSPAAWYRYSVWGTAVICAGSLVGIWFAVLFSCNPVAASWEAHMLADPGTKCVDRPPIYMTQEAFGWATDYLLLILPIPTLIGLQMNSRKKIGLIALFSIGSITLVTSIVRLVLLLPAVRSPDQPWDLSTGCVWVIVEANLLIMCASLPTLRVFFSRVAPSIFGDKSTKGDSYRRGASGGSYTLRTFGAGNDPKRKFDTLIELEHDVHFSRDQHELRPDDLRSNVHVWGGKDRGAESVDGVSAVGDANSEEGIVQTTTTTVSYAQR